MRVIELRRGPFAELLGRDVGSAASLIIVDTDVDGDGSGPVPAPLPADPRGHGMVRIDRMESLGHAEHTLLVPPMRSPLREDRPDRLEMIDIYQSPRFITEWI